jgi:hypothetical protein
MVGVVGALEAFKLGEGGGDGNCPAAGVPVGLPASRHDAAYPASTVVEKGGSAHATLDLALLQLDAGSVVLVEGSLVGEADGGAGYGVG